MPVSLPAVQAPHVVAWPPEYAPAPHMVHALATAAENFPARHGEQMPESVVEA